MPYTPPAHQLPATQPQSIPRRSFTNERGSGAFAPLASIPRRSSSSSTPHTKGALFHFRDDNSDDDNSDDDDGDDTHLSSFNYTTNPLPPPLATTSSSPPSLPALRLKPNNSFRMSHAQLQLNTRLDDDKPPALRPRNHYSPFKANVPFPTSSPLSPTPPNSSLPSITTTASSPLAAPQHVPSPPPSTPALAPPRPQVSRTSSSPVLLSNGKPLKSSLKSSSSSPNIPLNLPKSSVIPQMPSNWTRAMHARARSAPSTPGPEVLGATSTPTSTGHTHHTQTLSESNTTSTTHSSESSSVTTPYEFEYAHDPEDPSSSSAFPLTPKNVHFAENDGLAIVRVFNRSAKPASVANKGAHGNGGGEGGGNGSGLSGAEDTETETEGELSSSSGLGGGWMKWGWGVGGGSSRTNMATAMLGKKESNLGGVGGYPFPRISPATTTSATSHSTAGVSTIAAAAAASATSSKTRTKSVIVHNINEAASSPVPSLNPPKMVNIHLESLSLTSSPSPSTTLSLTGTLLVRNLTYEKNVAVRFTLDDWMTVSEVAAQYSCSLSALPGNVAERILSGGIGEENNIHNPWDRFSFTIRLEDYSSTISERALWLVARYTGIPGVNGIGGEWWDNNCGGNYCVRFSCARRLVEVPGEEGAEAKSGVVGPLNVPTRRRVVVSAPSAISSSPPSTSTSPHTSSAILDGYPITSVSPPFSSSSSPSEGIRAPAMTFSRSHPPSSSSSSPFSPTTATPSNTSLSSWNTSTLGVGTFGGYSSFDSFDRERGGEMEREKARVTQERLGRLSLRNYVAPGSSSTPAMKERREDEKMKERVREEQEREEEERVRRQQATPPDTPPRTTSPLPLPAPLPQSLTPRMTKSTANLSDGVSGIPFPMKRSPVGSPNGSRTGSPVNAVGSGLGKRRFPPSVVVSTNDSPVITANNTSGDPVKPSSSQPDTGIGMMTPKPTPQSSSASLSDVYAISSSPPFSAASSSAHTSRGSPSSVSAQGFSGMMRLHWPWAGPGQHPHHRATGISSSTQLPSPSTLISSSHIRSPAIATSGLGVPLSTHARVTSLSSSTSGSSEDDEELVTPSDMGSRRVIHPPSTPRLPTPLPIAGSVPSSPSPPITMRSGRGSGSGSERGSESERGGSGSERTILGGWRTSSPPGDDTFDLNPLEGTPKGVPSTPVATQPLSSTSSQAHVKSAREGGEGQADDVMEDIRGGLSRISSGGSDDELYKAFVRQWCFAGGPTSSAVVG